MKLSSLALPWFMVITTVTKQATLTSAQPTNLETLDEALLTDLLEQYATHEPTECNPTEGSTSFSFDWPGRNYASGFVPSASVEQLNFNAIMTHTDPVDANRTWSIRIGKSGNMYSHFTPNMWGETIPPQKTYRNEAPFVDEVQQMVAVTRNLDIDGKKHFIHQAGAYRRDGSYTNTPFFSPSLAKFCSGHSCSFASWGTLGHVPTPYTSPIIYINRYTNCGNGVIEFTQMMHHFANPNDPLSTSRNTHLDYFNVVWGGVRSSNLPYVLEPNPSTGAFNYANPASTSIQNVCPWNNAALQQPTDRKVHQSGGYTTFADDQLLLDQNNPQILPWCRKGSDSTCRNEETCMVSSCTQSQIDNEGYRRIKLQVSANSSPSCKAHAGGPGLRCNLRAYASFGQTNPYLSGVPCRPWANIFFVRADDPTRFVEVSFIKHWSWSKSNKLVYFTVSQGGSVNAAISLVNAAFDNRGSSQVLNINIVNGAYQGLPTNYSPGNFNAFTYVYGRGQEYSAAGGDILGFARRRMGATQAGVGTRDYTAFTINWFGSGAHLKSGETYINRGYYFNSNLKSVKTTAENLLTKTFADEFNELQYNPRTIDIWRSGDTFVAKSAATVGGDSTSCDSTATITCSGKSTPTRGYIAFFYVTCDSQTYFGPNPYHFSPSFGSRFPGHGRASKPVRSYVCSGQSSRPTWKLMGFFNPNDTGCADLADTPYQEDVCDAGYQPPTTSPTLTVSPSASPSTSQPTPGPSISLAPSISQAPSKSPTRQPTDAPTFHYYTACGASNSYRCGGTANVAEFNELHEVRCCADTNPGGWSQNSNCVAAGFNVWGRSEINGVCHSKKSFDQANAICESVVGARLCTKEELFADCAQYTGCGLDHEMIWTSTAVLSPTRAPSVFPTKEPSVPPTASPTESPTSSPTSRPSLDINECSDGTHTCHEKSRCINTHGGYTCECIPGYTGTGFECSNINECDNGSDDCDERAMCTDTEGSYICTCPEGWMGDGTVCETESPTTSQPTDGPPISIDLYGTETFITNIQDSFTSSGSSDSHVQDSFDHVMSVSGDGKNITAHGNSFKRFKLDAPFEILPSSVLKFTFSLKEGAEFQAICLLAPDEINMQDGRDDCFATAGPDSASNSGFEQIRPLTDVGETQEYEIYVGSYFTGQVGYIAFAQDNDKSYTDTRAEGEATWSDIQITRLPDRAPSVSPSKSPSRKPTYGPPISIDLYGTETFITNIQDSFTSSGSSDSHVQDSFDHVMSVSGDGKNITAHGNSFKRFKLDAPFEILPSSVLKFTFSLKEGAEFQAICLLAPDEINMQDGRDDCFATAGPDSASNSGFEQIRPLTDVGETQEYEIYVGSYFTGQVGYIAFAQDNDKSYTDTRAEGEATWSDIQITRLPDRAPSVSPSKSPSRKPTYGPPISIDLYGTETFITNIQDSFTSSGSSDSHVQDSFDHVMSVSGDGKNITAHGNSFKRFKLDAPFEILPSSVLKFTFSLKEGAEFQAICLLAPDEINMQDGRDDCFATAGPDSASNSGFEQIRPLTDVGETQEYEIYVGSYFTGQVGYIAFAQDNDKSYTDTRAEGEATWSDIQITRLPDRAPSVSPSKSPSRKPTYGPPISIDLYGTETFITNIQDSFTSSGSSDSHVQDSFDHVMSVSGDGKNITAHGNSFKRFKLDAPFEILPSSVLKFTFSLKEGAEFQAICLLAPDEINMQDGRDDCFATAGPDSASNSGFEQIRPLTDVGETQEYEIYVGSYFTGQVGYIAFAQDNDMSYTNTRAEGEATWSDIQITVSPTKAPSKSPTRQPTDAPTSRSLAPFISQAPSKSTFGYYTACGASNSYRCGGKANLALENELHEVRCCADTNPGGWGQTSNCVAAGFNVWGRSEINGVCHSKKSFDQANAICESVVGARLCTKEELFADCAQYTGCGLDHEMIWTSTAVSTPIYYTACGASNSYRCGGKANLALVNELHEVRCCADTNPGGWGQTSNCVAAGFNVWGRSEINGVCHSKKSFDQANAICESVVGARLCTKEELFADCAQYTGCGLDHEMIWTSTAD